MNGTELLARFKKLAESGASGFEDGAETAAAIVEQLGGLDQFQALVEGLVEPLAMEFLINDKYKTFTLGIMLGWLIRGINEMSVPQEKKEGD